MQNKHAAIFISFVCCAAFFMPVQTVGWGSLHHPASLFLYQFSHANIVHLGINLYALWQFAPRRSTTVVSVLVAAVAALIYSALCDCFPVASAASVQCATASSVCDCPAVASSVFPPACGLSAFLCAAFARRYVAHRLPTTRFLFWNILLIPLGWCLYLIPFLHINIISLFAWHIHLIAFYLSYFIWKVIYSRNNM